MKSNTLAFNVTNSATHLPWIDTMRFVAAFLVLYAHSFCDFFRPYFELDASQQNIVSYLFYSMSRFGHEAVIIFFVLSGYLVGGRGIFYIAHCYAHSMLCNLLFY